MQIIKTIIARENIEIISDQSLATVAVVVTAAVAVAVTAAVVTVVVVAVTADKACTEHRQIAKITSGQKEIVSLRIGHSNIDKNFVKIQVQFQSLRRQDAEVQGRACHA